MKLRDIINILFDELKLKQQEKWDNSGLQIGSMNSDIKKIMVILDFDENSLQFAIDNNIDLIITHHPFIFDSIKSIDFDTYDGNIIKEIIKHDICIYSMHTNFDLAENGVNKILAEKLNIMQYDLLHTVYDNVGYGGISQIDSINIVEYAKLVKENLNCPSIKLYCVDESKTIKSVAFCGGSGSEFISDAISKKADVYITGDVKYHQAQDALKNNLCIIDAGHYYTEYHSLTNIQIALRKYNLDIILLGINTVNEILL